MMAPCPRRLLQPVHRSTKKSPAVFVLLPFKQVHLGEDKRAFFIRAELNYHPVNLSPHFLLALPNSVKFENLFNTLCQNCLAFPEVVYIFAMVLFVRSLELWIRM